MLNFASAKHPGGGFLNGSLAQEESLALCSGLYACQTARHVHGPFYGHHAALKTPIYSHRVIFSPNVPVIRDDASLQLIAPYHVAVLTCAAVNAGVCAARGIADAVVSEMMSARIRYVLAVAASRQQRHLVLGAFGCGVFRNDPHDVARIFAAALRHDFPGSFQSVTFAVPAGPNHAAFAAAGF